MKTKHDNTTNPQGHETTNLPAPPAAEAPPLDALHRPGQKKVLSESFCHDFRALFKASPRGPKRLPALALVLALALSGQAASAQTWQTVDDLKIANDGYDTTTVAAMGKDPLGNIYAAGWAVLDPNIDMAAAVRSSSDGGTSWSFADFFNNSEPFPLPYQDNYYQYQYTAFTCDAAGNRFAVGQYFDWFLDPSGTNHPFARVSPAGSSGWSTLEDPNGLSSTGAAVDQAGNLYVVGTGPLSGWTVRKGKPDGRGGFSWANVDQFGDGLSLACGVFYHPTLGLFVIGTTPYTVRPSFPEYLTWLVRRSLDGGSTWTTVDLYQLTQKWPYSRAYGICADQLGNLYVVGEAVGHWIVRKSSNGGASWTTVDDFIPAASRKIQYSATAVTATADAHGNVFVAGTAGSAAGSQWTVRKSAGGTGTWQTVDSFQYVPGQPSTPKAIVGGNSGGVHVGGMGYDGNAYHWLVRRLAP